MVSPKKGETRVLVRQPRVSPERRECSVRALGPLRLFLAGEGNERDVPAPLDRDGDLSLVPGAVAGDASGQNLAPLGNEEPERLDVLVIDEGRFVDAEAAHFLADLEPSPLFAARTRSAVISIAPAGSPVSRSRRTGRS